MIDTMMISNLSDYSRIFSDNELKITRTTPTQDYSKENSPLDKRLFRTFMGTKKMEVVAIAVLIVALIGALTALIVLVVKIDKKPGTQQSGSRKVLFVIVDGIPADVIENLSIPNMKNIQKIGSYTRAYVGGDNIAYTETPTVSAPGYMNLLTGTWANKHNVYNNDVQSPNYHYKNIFRLFKESFSDKTIGIFSTWTANRLQLIGEGLATAGNITFDYKFDGYERDQITYPHDLDDHFIFDIDQRVTNETSTCIKIYGPDLSWVYLQYTDNIGHEWGDSEKFNQAVANVDNQIGQIWEAINYREKHHQENWLVLITTDHGRDPVTGQEHGDQTDRERTTWIITNSPETNSYFRDFQPAIVDIYPTIAKFLGLSISSEAARELDGVSLIGKVSLTKPSVKLNASNLQISWTVLDPTGDVKVWLSTKNLFQHGMTDNYYLIRTVPIQNNTIIVDVREYSSDFYKIALEGQYNTVNRWVISDRK